MPSRRRGAVVWILLGAGVVALGAAAIVGLGVERRHAPLGVVIPDPRGSALSALGAAVGVNLLPPPGGPVAAGSPIPGWTVSLGDGRRQSARVEQEGDEGLALVLSSMTPDRELRIVTPSIAVEPGTKFCLESRFRPDAVFAGSVVAVVMLAPRSPPGWSEPVERPLLAEPDERQPGGWLLARQGFAVPPGFTSARVEIRRLFVGDVCVRDVSLKRLREYPPKRSP